MRMSVTGHLEELRWRLVRSVIYLVIASGITCYFADDILSVLKRPSKGLIDGFLVLRPVEAISIYMKIALFSGFVLAAIPILWELFSFIKPAMGENDASSGSLKTHKLLAVKWVAAAFTLFAAGVAFMYFMALHPVLTFLMSLSKGLTGTVAQITLTSYISFVCTMLFCGGMIFQIPLISYVLTKMGVITPKLMSSKRKEAYFALCVVAVIINPSTDIFSMMLFAVPMIALYEIGILLSKKVYKEKVFPGGEVYEIK